MLDPAAAGTKLPDNQVQTAGDAYRTDYGVLSRKTAEDFVIHRGWSNIGIFGSAQRKEVQDDDSGFCSPPLWRTSPPRSPQHRRNHYRSLSPSSRAQAIARGQKELMEMVSRMPEGCYELSLKDIVEQPMVKEESFSEDRSINSLEDVHMLRRKKRQVGKKGGQGQQVNRSKSINIEGFLLKMVFPISFGSSKKKEKKININDPTIMISNCTIKDDGRVSPKPLLGDDGSAKSREEEWWKNKFPGSRESDESGSGLSSSNSRSSKSSGSSSSRSSSRNRSRQGNGGCCSFIFVKKGKAAE